MNLILDQLFAYFEIIVI